MSATLEPAPPASVDSNPTLLDVFRNPNFLKFWIAQVVSYLGDRIDQMAMQALVTTAAVGAVVGLTADEQADRASQIVFYGALPYLLVSPLIGALIDRMDRRRLLVIMDILRGVLILGVALLVDAKSHPAIIYGVVFLIGCATAVFAPTKSAYIPEIVPANHLLRANSVSATMGSLMTLIGTPIGALLVGTFGYQLALFVDSGTYFISMLMLLWIVRPRVAAADIEERKEELREEGGYFQNLLDGFKFVMSRRVPGTSVMLDSSFFFVGGILYASLNSIIYGRLAPVGDGGGADSSEAIKIVGAVFGVLGLGLFAGSVTAGRMAGTIRLGRVVATSFWGAALFMLALQLHVGVVLTCVIVFCLAFFAGGIVVSIETALQKSVPDEMRGRVFAMNSFLLNFFMLAAIQATTVLVLKQKLLTTEAALTIAAAVAGGAGLLALLRLPRGLTIRSMEPVPAHGE